MLFKRVLLSLALLMGLSTGAFASTWSVVVTGSAASTDETPATSAVTVNTTTATHVLVASSSYHTCKDLMTDNKSNKFKILFRQTNDNGSVATVWQAIGANGPPTVGAGHTFTPTADSACSDGGFTFSNVFVLALSTSATSTGALIDQTAGANGFSVSMLAAGPITPTAANEIVLSFINIDPGTSATAVVVPSGYTSVGTFNFASGQHLGGGFAYLIQTAATTTNPSWSWTDSNTAGALPAALNISLQNNLQKCTGGSPSWTAPDFDDVDTCHFLAVDGDKITVATGSYTITLPQLWNKAVKIVAQGYDISAPDTPGSVTIANSVCVGYCSTPAITITESPNGHVRMEGFNLVDGTTYSTLGFINVGRFGSPDTGKAVVLQGLKYHSSLQVGDRVLFEFTTEKGLVTHGDFQGTPHVNSGGICTTSNLELLQQNIASPNTPDWASAPTYGMDDTDGEGALYLEHSTIKDIDLEIDVADYARHVFRYSTAINSGIEMHGTDTSGTGARYAEVYNVDFEYDGSDAAGCGPGLPFKLRGYIAPRGGTMRVHHNIFGNDLVAEQGTPIELDFENIARDSGHFGCWGVQGSPRAGLHYPFPHQGGWGYNNYNGTPGGTVIHTFDDITGTFVDIAQDREPFLFFQNSGAGNGPPSIAVGIDFNDPNLGCGLRYGPGHDDASQYGIENDNYYVDKGMAFNGTVGIGSGTRAARPATCTTGVTYWSTDHNALDRCSATNTWTNNFYIPYTDPHPLTDAVTGPQLVFTTQPPNVHTGNKMGTFVVKATTDGSTVDTSFNGTVTIAHTAACGSTLSGTLTPTASSGVATLNAVVETTPSSGSCSFTATAMGYTSVVSNSFWVGPNQLGFTVEPSASYVSGVVVAVTSAIQFGDGTTDTADTDSNTLALIVCSSSITGGTTTKSASAGVLSWSVNVSNADTGCKFTSTDGTFGLTATSSAFDITGNNISITQNPGNITSGTAFSPTVAGTLGTPIADSMVLSLNAPCGTVGLTGSLTVSANASTGDFSWPVVGATGSGTGCSLKFTDATNGATMAVTTTTFDVTNGVLPTGVGRLRTPRRVIR